jgi:uncharacterized protein YecT (DUF1311 family)
MLKFLWLPTFYLIFCAASFAQQAQQPAAQAAPANPCDYANTQAAMNQCSANEYHKADAHLNALYKTLMGMLEQDADEAQKEKNDALAKQATTAVEKLRAAQIAWMHYRDLHCDAVRQQFEGGTISSLEWSTCMTDLANHRIAEMKSGYEIGDRKLE